MECHKLTDSKADRKNQTNAILSLSALKSSHMDFSKDSISLRRGAAHTIACVRSQGLDSLGFQAAVRLGSTPLSAEPSHHLFMETLEHTSFFVGFPRQGFPV